MKRVAIVGVGHSKFGDRRDVNLPELGFEAAKPAFEDANLTPKDIDFLSVGTAGGWYEEFLPAVVVSEYLGLSGKGLVDEQHMHDSRPARGGEESFARSHDSG